MGPTASIRRLAVSPRPLLYRTKIPVEPIEFFLLKLEVGRDMAALPQNLPLVSLRRTKEPKHRTRGCFERKEEIVSAIDHERGNLEPGKEIEGIGLGRLVSIETQAGAAEHCRFQALLTHGDDGRQDPK